MRVEYAQTGGLLFLGVIRRRGAAVRPRKQYVGSGGCSAEVMLALLTDGASSGYDTYQPLAVEVMGGGMKFLLALHTDDGRSFGVTVPGLPGCFSAGDGLEGAIENARVAIDLSVEEWVDETGSLPKQAGIAEYRADPLLADAVWAVVDVDVERYLGPSKKINITMPVRALEEIDAYASVRGKSRSGFLLEAARKAMADGK